MSKFVLSAAEADSPDRFTLTFVGPTGRSAGFAFARRALELPTGDVMWEVTASEEFRTACPPEVRENSFLNRVTTGFASLSADGWDPQALVRTDDSHYRLSLRHSDSRTAVLDIAVPEPGADPERLVVTHTSGEVGPRLDTAVRSLVRFFDMVAAEGLEIDV